MKVRSFIFGMLLGAAVSSVAAIYGNNERWEWEAYEHKCAVWTTDFVQPNRKLTWKWLDDYYYDELNKHLHPSPTSRIEHI